MMRVIGKPDSHATTKDNLQKLGKMKVEIRSEECIVKNIFACYDQYQLYCATKRT